MEDNYDSYKERDYESSKKTLPEIKKLDGRKARDHRRAITGGVS